MLVAVLLLVGLATALVVTATMMARVERKAAANSAKIEQARANALFALDVALNQLQTAAGPDQRVTARAEILDSNPSTSAVDGVNQPFWTGVWKTGTNQLDVGGADAQRNLSLTKGGTANPPAPSVSDKVASATWLVSGNGSLSPINFSGTPGANATIIAKNFGTSSANVTVPLIPLVVASGNTTTTNGAYGYWVSDEGVKAKVNMKDPTFGANHTSELPKNLLHFVAPQAFAAHKGSDEFGTIDLRTKANDIPKITTLQSLANIAGLSSLVGGNTTKIAADFTTSSWGVLADVRNGGLKKDLTAAFEDSGNTPNKNYAKLNPDGTARVYQARDSSSDTVPNVGASSLVRRLDGLRWINLYYHYNLYKSTAPAVNMFGRSVNGTSPAGVGNSTAGNRPYTVAPRGIGWSDPSSGGTAISYGVLSPVFLGLRWDITFNALETAPGNGKYNLYLNYYPQFILYNPYSVRISSSANNFRFARAFGALSNMYLQIAVQETTETKYYHVALNLGGLVGASQRLLYNTNFDDIQTLEPGEIRVFGLNSNIPASLKSGDSPNGAVSEFKFSTPPYGLVSKGFAVNNHKYAIIQKIAAYNATASSNPLLDTYENIDLISAGSRITLRLTGRPPQADLGTLRPAAGMNVAAAGGGDVSIPSTALWPTIGGSGGSVLPVVNGDPNTSGLRIFLSSSPGSSSTGIVNPNSTRPDLSALVETLTGETQVFSFFVRKKGINQTGGSTFSNSNNSIPYFCGNSIQFNLAYDLFGACWWDELYVSDLLTWPNYPNPTSATIQTTLTPDGYTTTSWGEASTGASTPPTNIGSRNVLFDVPLQPMVSIGQFMHLQPFYMSTTGNYTALAFGSMFTGGSLPSPEVPMNQTVSNLPQRSPNSAHLAIDHSFLVNQALFDSYFFSTVPPATLSASTTYPVAWSDFNNANNSGSSLTDSSKPLLNSRMRPYFKNGIAPLMADLRDMDKAAANLKLDGAFNINSTSVAAWRAFLSSLSGNDLDIWDASTQTSKTLNASALQNPFVRFQAANSNGNINDLWSGIRALSDAEIDDLANKIVAEIKMRGPFLSMADFLNRRLGSSSSLTRAGALQAAIDKTTLNNAAKAAGVDVSVPTTGVNSPPITPITTLTDNMKDATGATWRTTIGAPGYLMQQDLVQALSPAMTARSDTFVIRTYGEVRNPSNGNIESKAWAEAVVQRVPDLVDGSQLPETSQSALNTTNQTFGRRFQIVSFRWLHPNEI